MSGIRAWHHGDFQPEPLVEAKVARGRHVSVCLPARNEEGTIGAIVEALTNDLVDRSPLIDEVLVFDDGSSDATARVASRAGASVVTGDQILEECGPGRGKGNALWKSLYAAKGDLLVFCDADLRDFQSHFVTGLLGPLLTRDEVGFVKGYYRRPVGDHTDGGGRVTELVARPVLALLFPHLAGIVQPLGGEYAGRREILEQVPFVEGYGVDLGLLIDVSDRWGVASVGQVDLGSRVHRNRSLAELSPQAEEVLRTALTRAGALPAGAAMPERPPMIGVPEYRNRS